MHASRNIALCTKDCLCLFVCPTGATNTETGQIDAHNCLDGCRRCVDACPSGAIYLVMDDYPEPSPKNPDLADLMIGLMERKSEQESRAASIVAGTVSPGEKKLTEALRRSCRIVAEDCAREAGYMLPRSKAVRTLLEGLRRDANSQEAAIIARLLDSK